MAGPCGEWGQPAEAVSWDRSVAGPRGTVFRAGSFAIGGAVAEEVEVQDLLDDRRARAARLGGRSASRAGPRPSRVPWRAMPRSSPVYEVSKAWPTEAEVATGEATGVGAVRGSPPRAANNAPSRVQTVAGCMARRIA